MYKILPPLPSFRTAGMILPTSSAFDTSACIGKNFCPAASTSAFVSSNDVLEYVPAMSIGVFYYKFTFLSSSMNFSKSLKLATILSILVF